MISLKRIYPVDTALWSDMEHLYVEAFPRNERRSAEVMRRLADCGRMVVEAVVESDEDGKCGMERFAGFITWWDFGEFVYGEHFAILPERRDAGAGGAAIERFTTDVGKPVVIEVETPKDEMSRRRVSFYERHGFEMCPMEYLQPPYDATGDGVDMRLLTYGMRLNRSKFEAVRGILYAEVYEQKEI